jgi:hypothetical protein
MSPSAERHGAVDAIAGVRAEDLTLADVQHLVDLAVRAYGRILDAEEDGGPILPAAHGVTATDAARAAGALLAALNVEVFELALFQTWGGSPWSAPLTGTPLTSTPPDGQKAGNSHA